MPFLSPSVLDRCCLRCWGFACLLPGSFLLFWALSSLVESVGTLVLIDHWSHPTGQRIAELFPAALQNWLTDPHSWHGVHVVVAGLVELPLMVLLAVPGGIAVFSGLCLCDEAHQEALDEDKGVNPSHGLRSTAQLFRRRS